MKKIAKLPVTPVTVNLKLLEDIGPMSDYVDYDDEPLFDEDDNFQRCSDCDGHDACRDFGCAVKLGIFPNADF